MNQQRDYVSHSFLSMLQRCGMQAKFRYLDGIKAPPGIRMIRGSAVDKSVTQNMRAKRDQKKMLSAEEIESITSDAMDLGVADGLALTEEEEEQGAQKVIGAAKDSAIALAKLHAKAIAPRIEPDIIQAEIKSAKPIDLLNGKKLLTVLDLTSKAGVVHDTKTSGKSKSQQEADRSQQLSIYSFSYYLAKGELPTAVQLDALIEAKKGPHFQQIESQRTWPQINATLEAMGRAQKIFESGIFLPTNPENWWCSRKWCGYAQMCPFYVKEAEAIK